ncbi:MAG TPA: hypothetical protein VF037_05600 [Gemmatimonadales bacterium]
MEGLGFPVFIFLAWLFFSLFRQAAQGQGRSEKPRRPPVPRPPESGEGTTFDFFDVLRELERARGQQARGEQARPVALPDAMPRRALETRIRRIPDAADEESSFREEASVEDLEVSRSARAEVSLDQASEETARRRREAAERRDRPRTAADHAAFDARIRSAPAPAADPSEPGPAASRLRSAFVWAELLGPPKALRDD